MTEGIEPRSRARMKGRFYLRSPRNFFFYGYTELVEPRDRVAFRFERRKAEAITDPSTASSTMAERLRVMGS